MKALAANPQQSRCFSLVTTSQRQNFRNVFRFNFRERLRLLAMLLRADSNANRFRQIVHLNLPVRRDDHRTLDGVGKFTHVAGKLVATQQSQRLSRYLARLAPMFCCIRVHGLRQFGQVSGAFAQWRHADLHHMQPVVQVFAKPPPSDRIAKVNISQSNQARIYFDKFAAAGR